MLSHWLWIRNRQELQYPSVECCSSQSPSASPWVRPIQGPPQHPTQHVMGTSAPDQVFGKADDQLKPTCTIWMSLQDEAQTELPWKIQSCCNRGIRTEERARIKIWAHLPTIPLGLDKVWKKTFQAAQENKQDHGPWSPCWRCPTSHPTQLLQPRLNAEPWATFQLSQPHSNSYFAFASVSIPST